MGGHLRILSANLASGKADPQAFADLVQSLRPDALAVQELTPEQAEALAPLFAYGSLEPARDYRGMGLALSAPAKVERLPLDYRPARMARLEPAAWPQLRRPVEVINVHFSAPVARPYWRQPARRYRQVRRLVQHLEASPDQARAVVGDYNATPLWPAYRTVSKRLEDLPARFARQQGRRPARTWRRWMGGPCLLRIDHCLANGLEADHVELHDVRGSDHRAVQIDVSLR